MRQVITPKKPCWEVPRPLQIIFYLKKGSVEFGKFFPCGIYFWIVRVRKFFWCQKSKFMSLFSPQSSSLYFSSSFLDPKGVYFPLCRAFSCKFVWIKTPSSKAFEDIWTWICKFRKIFKSKDQIFEISPNKKFTSFFSSPKILI